MTLHSRELDECKRCLNSETGSFVHHSNSRRRDKHKFVPVVVLEGYEEITKKLRFIIHNMRIQSDETPQFVLEITKKDLLALVSELEALKVV